VEEEEEERAADAGEVGPTGCGGGGHVSSPAMLAFVLVPAFSNYYHAFVLQFGSVCFWKVRRLTNSGSLSTE
jgi:hypothetical protein